MPSAINFIPKSSVCGQLQNYMKMYKRKNINQFFTKYFFFFHKCSAPSLGCICMCFFTVFLNRHSMCIWIRVQINYNVFCFVLFCFLSDFFCKNAYHYRQFCWSYHYYYCYYQYLHHHHRHYNQYYHQLNQHGYSFRPFHAASFLRIMYWCLIFIFEN